MDERIMTKYFKCFVKAIWEIFEKKTFVTTIEGQFGKKIQNNIDQGFQECLFLLLYALQM
jgi:hypothetical protein